MKIKKIVVLLVSIVILVAGGCNMGESIQIESSQTNAPSDSTKRLIRVAGVDYTVQESDTIPLLTSKVTNDVLQQIAMSVCVSAQLSTHTTTGEISGINSISPVRELRHINLDNEDYSYCIYENRDGGRLYVFFYGKGYWTNAAFYSEKQLTFNDFLQLKKGKSTQEDVAKIAPSINVKQVCDEFNSIRQTESTFHMTKEGYVEILYTKKRGKNFVKKVLTKENKLIQSINKNDFGRKW